VWWQTDSLHWLRVGNHQRRQCVRLKRLIIGAQLFVAGTAESESLWHQLANFIVDFKALFLCSYLTKI
jgi:hypothetical protein